MTKKRSYPRPLALERVVYVRDDLPGFDGPRFETPEAEHRWRAESLARDQHELTDEELARLVADGAPPDDVSPERWRRLCVAFVGMLPARRGRRPMSPEQRSAIVEAVWRHIDEGKGREAAYEAAKSDVHLSPRRIAEIFNEHWSKRIVR